MTKLGKPGSGGWFAVIGAGLLAAFVAEGALNAGGGAAIAVGIGIGAMIWLVLCQEAGNS
jgi:hypothetical protein